MSVRGRLKVQIAISSTTAEDRDLGNGSYEVVTDLPDDGGSWKIKLPASTVNLPVALGNVSSATFLGIRAVTLNPTDVPVDIILRKNSTSGEAWTISPINNQEGWFVSSTDTITSIFLSNPGAIDMQVSIFLLGSA